MRIVVKNLPQTATQTEIETHFAKKGHVTDVYMLHNGKNEFRRVCFIGYASSEEAEDAIQYFNCTYFKNHKITVERVKETANEQKPSEIRLRRALYSKTIVIRNIKDLSEEILLENLIKYGPVTDLQIKKRETGSMIAIVKFKKGEDAEKALKEIKVIAGCRVRIGNYLENPIDIRKEHFNSLFFNFETVVKRTCEIEKIDRNALLNLKDRDLGSRMALLETNLVLQTKKFLENNGIFLDRISGTSENVVILRTSDLLGALDLIKGDFRVNIAPSKCLALLIFKDSQQAILCCKEMNMRRFKNEVVYCELAPTSFTKEGVTETTPEQSRDEIGDQHNGRNKPANKIVVKNVPFQATQEELKKIFSAYTHVVDVRLPKKSDGTHRGFGFVVLDSSKHADEAIEYFGSSTHLYGRRLVLEKAKL